MKNIRTKKLYTPKQYEGNHFQIVKNTNRKKEHIVHVIEPDYFNLTFKSYSADVTKHRVYIPYQVYVYDITKNVNNQKYYVNTYSNTYFFCKDNPISYSSTKIFPSYLPNTNYSHLKTSIHDLKLNKRSTKTICFGNVALPNDFGYDTYTNLIPVLIDVSNIFLQSQFNYELGSTFSDISYDKRKLQDYIPLDITENYIHNNFEEFLSRYNARFYSDNYLNIFK